MPHFLNPTLTVSGFWQSSSAPKNSDLFVLSGSVNPCTTYTGLALYKYSRGSGTCSVLRYRSPYRDSRLARNPKPRCWVG